jgi:hypothetical protein
MILTVVHDQETNLAIAVTTAVALFGAGLTQGFPSHDPNDPKKLDKYRETGAAGGGIQVQCTVSNGPFVRAAFVAVKFQVLESVGQLVRPQPTDVRPHTVTPAQPDEKYPLGAETTGRVAATALCGACVTQGIPPGNDPFDGDPAVSMRVDCAESQKATVIAAFGAVGFGVDLN